MVFAPTLDWLLALVPVMLMVALFVWLDVFKLMSLPEILVLLLLGAVAAAASYPIAGRVIDALPLGFTFYSKFLAPWIEESLKAIAVLFLFWRNRIGYKLDAVISGFAIGAGFSVIENILYLLRFPELGTGVWMVRGLGTALMHGATTAILAATLHELSDRELRDRAAEYRFHPLWIVPGLIAAGLIHTLFNQFPNQPVVAMMGALIGAPLVLMAIFAFGSKEAQGWLVEESRDHRAALEALQAGRFPDGESGRRIAGLAARLDQGGADRVRAYLTSAMRLTVAAEEKLLGQPIPPAKELLAELDAMASLKAAMGRTGWAALEPLLPFSRNDQWEVSELVEDLRREA